MLALRQRRRHPAALAPGNGQPSASLVGAWHARYNRENPVASRMSQHRTAMLKAGLDAVLRAPTDAVQSMGDPSNLHCWRGNRYLALGEGAETASPTSNQVRAHEHHVHWKTLTESHPPSIPSWFHVKPAVLGLSS